MCKLVTDIEQVKQNVKQFNADLRQNTDIISQLSMFRHWYFIDELGMFGPSKFIGYAGINTENYRRGKGKDGRDTEPVLAAWFRKATMEEQELLAKDLDILVAGYGKKVKSNFIIHVRR